MENKLKQYQCHKTVEAGQIRRIEKKESDAGALEAVILIIENHNLLEPEHSVSVTVRYYEKHQPQAGGYYVKYEDGYESYSPAAAFESGYSLMEEKHQAIPL